MLIDFDLLALRVHLRLIVCRQVNVLNLEVIHSNELIMVTLVLVLEVRWKGQLVSIR